MNIIYYDSKTGNVERFISKIRLLTDWTCIKITEKKIVNRYGHLVTYTTKMGEVPASTQDFINENGEFILSVSTSGNMNWGGNYGLAGDKIALQCKIPLLLKFELSGLEQDVTNFILNVNTYANQKMDTPQ